MKSLVRGVKSAVAVVAVVLPLAGTGCEANNQSLLIVGALAHADGSCLYTPGTNIFLASPTLDAALAKTYTAYFEVRSQLVSRQDYQNVRAEPNRFVVTGAEVRLTDGLGNTLSSFTSLASGTPVEPQSANAAGAIVPITIIDPATAEKFARDLKPLDKRQLVAFVKIFGQTLGNKSIESGEYQFVVSVCKQCLVSFSASATDPALPLPNCGAPRKDAAPGKGVCAIGQDDIVSCQDCQNNPGCKPVAP
jgi:hypothetical protein